MASVPSAFTTGSGSGFLGNWHLITSTALSAVSSVSFTSASIVNYNKIWFTFSSVVGVASNTVNLGVSNNGGSSYSSVNLYITFSNNSSTGANIGAPAELFYQTIVAATFTGCVSIDNPNVTDIKLLLGSYDTYIHTGVSIYTALTGYTDSTAQINAFQFSMVGGGSFSTGTINMYGQ